MPRLAWFFGATIAFAPFVLPQAQQAQTPSDRPTFRLGINVVQVDVSVLDDQRRPVRDLTAADFTVHSPRMSLTGPICNMEALEVNAKALLFLCAISASCLLATDVSRADQTAAERTQGPQTPRAQTAYPDWPWPKAASEPSKPDDGQLFHIPESTKSYTDTQINGSTGTVDWFPELHPAPPAPVIAGKNGAYHACGQCHLIDGRGKPDTADLRGLHVAYVLQQLSDMKDGKRRGSVPPVVANLTDRDIVDLTAYIVSLQPGR
jgi:cytochrome c553